MTRKASDLPIRGDTVTLESALTAAGIGYVRTVITEAEANKVPVECVCVLLVKESYGGQSIYGRDPTPVGVVLPYAKGGPVTRDNYAAYKAGVLAGTWPRQGVGPMQLTHWSLQDEADADGGCWDPVVNIRVGVRHFASLLRVGPDLWTAFRRYNGTGPRAEAYADHALTLLPTWQRIVEEAMVGLPNALIAALRRRAVPYTEYAGWGTRNTGRPFTPLAITLHDSVTGAMSDDRAAEFCRDGRTNLAGPLYTALLGRDGVLRLIGWGTTNNSGSTVRARVELAKAGDMPLDRELPTPTAADDYFATNQQHHGVAYVTEAAGPYTDLQRQRMPQVLAAFCECEGWSPEGGAGSVIGHGEATRRKSDPALDMGDVRRQVLAALRGDTPPPQEDDDMYDEGDRRKLDALCRAVLGDFDPSLTDEGRSPLPGSVAAGVAELKARPLADVDEAALADALAERGLGGVRTADVIEAVRQAFARAGQSGV